MQLVVIFEAQLDGGFIADLDQLTEVSGEHAADRLACLPDRLPPLGVLRGLEHLADFAVGHLLAVDPGPEDVEGLLHLVGDGGHLFEQGGIDLLLQISQIEQIDLTGQDGVVDAPFLLDGLELLEGDGIGQCLVDAVLGFLLFLKIFVLAGGLGLPPGEVPRHLQRPQPGNVVLNELLSTLADLQLSSGRRVQRKRRQHGHDQKDKR